jgi:hypothetical protein
MRGGGESVSDFILLNTWAKGPFPFPGIFITEAGVYYCFRFHFSEHVGERNISVSWYLNHGAEVVGYFRSVLLNTWAIGTFPFPGIFITEAGVFYCFRFPFSEHVGERNISVSWYLNHGVRGILLSVSVSILLNTWAKGTFPFPGILITG